MAFVHRSPKKSPFSTCQTLQKTGVKSDQQEKNEQRIHKRSSEQFKKLLNCKVNKQSRMVEKLSTKPSIPSCQNDNNLKNEQQITPKLTYNFRLIKKSKPKYKLNDESDNQSLQHIKQFYDIPGSFQQKTLVKYRKVSSQLALNKNSQTPGPATYSPKIDSSVASPKFASNTFTNSLVKNQQQEQNQEITEKQNLFPVKYNYMNSISFKKSPNLLTKSNKLLLSKIFHLKQNQKQTKTLQQKQFESLQNKKPGPQTYNNLIMNENKAILFGKTKRFRQILSCGSGKFYQQQKTKSAQKYSSSFHSMVERFQDSQHFPVSLQYTNYQNSLIKQSKNRKNLAFDSNVSRSYNDKIDQRPYYGVQALENNTLFMAKFGKFKERRNLIWQKIQECPGPSQYNLNTNWIKQHSYIIGKHQNMPGQIQDNQKQKNQQKNVNFFLCSQMALKKGQIMTDIQKKHAKKKLKFPKCSKIKQVQENQQRKLQYYNISPNWEIKSFNRHFANDYLGGNNPIQNKLL